MSLLKKMIIGLAILTLTNVAIAKDVYVKTGASGTGSIDSPYGNLWKAVDRAKRGDVIHVAKGTYNGKSGNGHFIIKVPELTMVGGYTSDFKTRHPFKNLTVLERATDYRGDLAGLPEAIIAGDQNLDHGNLIVDGFVLNGQSRNNYSDKKILPKKSYKGALFQTRSKNTKLRHSILLNAYGNGIYLGAMGKDNEISNCFILNTFYAGISTRSAQEGSIVKIKNNTIAFGWYQPGKGGSAGIIVGSQGKAIVENNVIAFQQTEGGDAGFGVLNSFGNDDLEMVNNVFFSLTGGFYKFLDNNGANMVIWKSSDLADLNAEDNWEDYMLYRSGGNRAVDPGLRPDLAYATMFANFIASTPGKLDMGAMNNWRRSVGLPLQAAAGSPRDNWALPYPLSKVLPNLTATLSGVGAQAKGIFPFYKSKTTAAPALNYKSIDFASMKKGGKHSKGAGTLVQFKALMGNGSAVFEINKHAPRSDYICVELIKQGQNPDASREKVYGYLLKGTAAYNKWMKYEKKRNRYNTEGGINIKGKLYSFDNQSYPYAVGIVIDSVKR